MFVSAASGSGDKETGCVIMIRRKLESKTAEESRTWKIDSHWLISSCICCCLKTIMYVQGVSGGTHGVPELELSGAWVSHVWARKKFYYQPAPA